MTTWRLTCALTTPQRLSTVRKFLTLKEALRALGTRYRRRSSEMSRTRRATRYVKLPPRDAATEEHVVSRLAGNILVVRTLDLFVPVNRGGKGLRSPANILVHQWVKRGAANTRTLVSS